MEFNINDPKNIVGITSLIKNEDTKSILDIEKEIVNGTNIQEEEENDTNQYKKDMERLANMYNIDDIDEEQPGAIPAVEPSPIPQKVVEDFGEIEDDQLKYMTMEQKKQNYVDDVLHDLNSLHGDDKDLAFDIDREKEEDDKNTLLEQIDMLRMTLEDDGIDVTNIPSVSKSHSLSDIQNVYKILRLKNDRNRYCSFAEELILSGVYGIEYLFDGKKEWFGRRPDLTGFHSTARVKLRRCRYQTSTLVKEIMQEYNMSPGIQLLIELIPSMFLYSRQRKMANTDNIASDAKYNEAISNLNKQFG